MKKIFISLILLLYILSIPSYAYANQMPCSIILHPNQNENQNARGVALIYKVKLTPSFPRTSISIMGLHLPRPDTLGDFNGYTGIAYIPNEISWQFSLIPTNEDDTPNWTGKFDLITAPIKDVHIEVRLSHSKREKLGPVILSNTIQECKE